MSVFVPKPDQEGINSPRAAKPLKDAAILLFSFLLMVTTFYFVFVSLSDWALPKMSLYNEIKWLGILNKNLTDKNPKDFDKLVEHINTHVNFPIQITVNCSEEPNAFALPGGLIILTRGLLENIKSENGLAFVIGHEIGHIINRDHIRGMGRQIIFAVGASLIGFNDVFGFSNLNQTIARVYDRQQEVAADQYGLELTQKMYGHNWGTEELFNLLASKENIIEKSLARIVSTHPPSTERLERIKVLQTGEPQKLKKPSRPFSEWLQNYNCEKK